MPTGRIPIIEVSDAGREVRVGAFVWNGPNRGGHGRFVVTPSLSDERKAEIRQRWATALDAGANLAGPIVSVGNRTVHPWSGFLGTFEALDKVMPVVGLEVALADVEWPPFEDQTDIYPEINEAAQQERIEYAEAVMIAETDLLIEELQES